MVETGTQGQLVSCQVIPIKRDARSHAGKAFPQAHGRDSEVVANQAAANVGKKAAKPGLLGEGSGAEERLQPREHVFPRVQETLGQAARAYDCRIKL